MLDCFWEWPFPFQKYAHQTDRDEVIDMFAGRVYGEEAQQSVVLGKMRKLLEIKHPNPSEQGSY